MGTTEVIRRVRELRDFLIKNVDILEDNLKDPAEQIIFSIMEFEIVANPDDGA